MIPRAVVEVRWGPRAGDKAVIAPGASLRVGRHEDADLSLPGDRHLWGRHFELAWDGERCRLRTLHPEGKTLLGGQEIEGEVEVPHGGWIRAGGTDFLVYVEGRGAPVDGDEDIPPPLLGQRAIARERAREALATLRAEAAREPLYAILDGARDARILPLLRSSVEKHRSLYEGAQGETLEDAAPYLAGPMEEGSALLDHLVTAGWGRRWGIYCTSREPFAEVRRHFRRFLMVEVEETGARLYFRFYDPGALRDFLPTCGPGQIASFMTGLGGLFYEDPHGRLRSRRAPRPPTAEEIAAAAAALG